VLVLALAGVAATRVLLAERDELPALVGQAIGAHTGPADVVLTNYDTNPLVPGTAGEAYVLKLPEVTFYADRVVRGGLQDGPDLEEALERVPAARWFLLTPWPAPPSEGLLRALDRVAGERLQLSLDPPVVLLGLRR
jgi:hypothetical protein